MNRMEKQQHMKDMTFGIKTGTEEKEDFGKNFVCCVFSPSRIN